MKNVIDDFEEWAPAPAPKAAPQFEVVAARPRRLEVLTVTWRNEAITFEPEARLMFGKRTAVVSPVVLWPPTVDVDHPFPRQGWAADVHIIGCGFVQGKGETAQAALDALSLELPACSLMGMVSGGSC